MLMGVYATKEDAMSLVIEPCSETVRHTTVQAVCVATVNFLGLWETLRSLCSDDPLAIDRRSNYAWE
jgi:hypothetical protein